MTTPMNTSTTSAAMTASEMLMRVIHRERVGASLSGSLMALPPPIVAKQLSAHAPFYRKQPDSQMAEA